MAQTIQLKHSYSTGSWPTDLADGEVAVNLADHKMWIGSGSTSQSALNLEFVTASHLDISGHTTTSGDITGSGNVAIYCAQMTASAEIAARVIHAATGVYSARFYQGASHLAEIYCPIAGNAELTTVGAIEEGTWLGGALQPQAVVASAYLDADTAHLTTDQTFTGKKTFSAAITCSTDISASGYVSADSFRGQKIQLVAHSFGSNTTALFGANASNVEAGQLICGHASWGWSDRAWSSGETKADVETNGIDLTMENHKGFVAPYKLTNIEFMGQLMSNQSSTFNLTYYLYKHTPQNQSTDGTQQLTPLWSQSLAHSENSSFTDFYATGSTGFSCNAGDYLYVFAATGQPTNGNIRGSYTVTAEIVETN